MSEEGLDRRTFLKTAAAIGTTMAAASTVSAETAKKPSSSLPGERIAGPRLLPNLFPWVAFSMQTRTPRQDMPAYRKDHLGDQDLADIYAYLGSVKPSPAAASLPLLNFEGKR
jgi:hypothetical protein